jgi:hypothetical protein
MLIKSFARLKLLLITGVKLNKLRGMIANAQKINVC